MFSHLFKHGFAHIIVHLTYLTGLALFFPIAVKALELHTDIWNVSRGTLILSLTLIIAGAGILWRAKGSLSGTLKSLGILTFLPGVVFLLVTFFGKEKLAVAGQSITGMSVAGAAVNFYIAHGVPELALVASLYMATGPIAYWIGSRLESVANRF